MDGSLELSGPLVKTCRKNLQRLLRDQPARIKGATGAKLVTGEIPYQLSPGEAADIVGTHPRVVHQALGRQPVRMSDTQVVHWIERIGIERIWQALDRLTEPELPFSVAAE
jgi:hypothetical protein